MGHRLPEYTQEEINRLLAMCVLGNECENLDDEQREMLDNIANDNYILVSEEEIGR